MKPRGGEEESSNQPCKRLHRRSFLRPDVQEGHTYGIEGFLSQERQVDVNAPAEEVEDVLLRRAVHSERKLREEAEELPTNRRERKNGKSG